jgi:hypothetical protein
MNGESIAIRLNESRPDISWNFATANLRIDKTSYDKITGRNMVF